jgi:hypothetical protein
MARKLRSDGPGRFADRLRDVSETPAAGTAPGLAGPHGGRAEHGAAFTVATLTSITGGWIDVIAKNLSTTGARIEFLSNTLLPDRVLLSEPTTRLQVWAYVILQEPGAAGLEFFAT